MNFTKALADGLAKAKGRIEDALGDNLNAAADEGERVMKARVPILTGELRDSIQREDSGGVKRIRVSAPHAAVTEWGSSTQPPQPYWRPGVAAMRRASRARRVRSR